MRLKHPITILLILCSLLSKAQLYDAQWVFGYGNGISKIDFRNDTIKLDTLPGFIPLYTTSACISDEQGNLLYVCNGDIVTDRNGDTLENGANLNPCSFTSENQQGLPIQQAALFLPMPDNSRFYYLIHFSGDTFDGRPATLFYSVIDKEANGGLGAIVKKNMPFYRSLFRAGGMTACKHANGRDWWIIMAEYNHNSFYKFLLTPSGISDTLIQNIGVVYHGPFDEAYSCFTQDGTKFATGCYEGPLEVFDFDRCTGEFSNMVKINSMPAPATVAGSGPIAFSPNGRFLYSSDRLDLTQYDLWNANVQDSAEIYRADSSDHAQIDFINLAPNGKIYGSTFNGGFYFLHVINYPDSLGSSCGFVYGGQPTLSLNTINLPNLPNYKLGPLIGSGCDTITTGLTALTANDPLRVQPNPANKYAYVEMGMQGNYTFQLLDATGKLIGQKQTPQIDIFDTEQLPNGIYFISVKDRSSNVEIANRRVVVAH